MPYFGWMPNRRGRYRFCRWLFVVLLLAFFITKACSWLVIYSEVQALSHDCLESDEFRDLRISPENLKLIQQCANDLSVPFQDCLAVTMVMNRFDLSQTTSFDENEIIRVRNYLMRKREDSFRTLTSAYEKIFSDLEYYPIPLNSKEGQRKQSYFENSFGESRDFGGKRSHEGIDIFGKEDVEGYYPVVSVTEGTVEKIGWLTLGGYRIGIRSPHGGYFYYAHLSEYAKEFQEGDRVMAGELLGFMGNTGYGPEGTKGKFPVHLHFGIYISVTRKKEMSVNPYPILMSLKKIQEYHY